MIVIPKLISIQVSQPRQFGQAEAVDPMDRHWATGFFKEPVSGVVWVGSSNLDGDGQADRVHHGGRDKAVLAYSAEHYPEWRKSMDNLSLPFGAFGENFTIEGLAEAVVCIGDTFQLGEEAIVQVSQPRQPCWKLARRWRIRSLASQVQQTGRTAWYFRVQQEGFVAAGMSFVLLERPHPSWTIERANWTMHVNRHDVADVLELAAVTHLSDSWRKTLMKMANNQVTDPMTRLYGEND